MSSAPISGSRCLYAMSHHDHASALPLEDEALSLVNVPVAYGASPERDGGERESHKQAFEWPEMARIALVGLAAAAVWFRVWEPVSAFSAVGVAGLLIGGWPIFKEALENL